MKCRVSSRRVGSELKTKADWLRYVYVARAEYRNNVCDSKEDGEIESVDIGSTFRNFEERLS